MKILHNYQSKAVAECWDALKESDSPILLLASVGAGKSLMISDILLTIQNHGKRALCLVHSADLVENNSKTFVEQGGNAGIYCALLGSKETENPIIFGTPQSILNGINKNGKIREIKFNLIIVDEAHSINHLADGSCFMRIFRHYKQNYSKMRLLGATGTDFRFRGSAIVGEGCLFRKRVGNISTGWLIKEKYLISPTFNIDEKYVIDFSRLKLQKNGKFNNKELTNAVEKNCRKTELICKQIVHIMESQNRYGVFVFASTANHAREIVSHLPTSQTALILGSTPQNERTEALNKARKGEIRYLVNIAIISVGIDVPPYDTIAYLRPTESLVLLIQTLGRALRLSPLTGKNNALILDFAGNIERHSDWDDPILLDAIKQTIDKDRPLVIQCPKCNTLNTENARRCIGIFEKESELIEKKSRCDYYFEFKECLNQYCNVKNDIAARNCHACGNEIIDPNSKLSLERIKPHLAEVKVLKAEYMITGPLRGFRINCTYLCKDKKGSYQKIHESYSPASDKSTNIFYAQFVKKHCKEASKWYLHLNNRKKVEEMMKEIQTPCSLFVANENNKVKIKKKIFQ